MTEASSTPPPPPPAPAAAGADTEEESRGKRVELLAAIILGIAATLTAWAAYQSGAAGGDELQGYTLSNQQLADANFFYSSGNSRQTADSQLFLSFAVARTEGNEDLATYVRETLMDDNLRAAVDWWEATDEAVTPFDDIEGNPYVIAEYDEADTLQAAAEESLQESLGHAERGDKFDRATILLALTLFFGGIALVIDRASVAMGMLVVAAMGTVAGAAIIFTA